MVMVTYLTRLLHVNASIYKESLYIRFVIYNEVDKKLMQQEMSQSRYECPQRNWSSIRHM